MGRSGRNLKEQAQYKVVIRELAKDDISKIVNWYDSHAPGVSPGFIENLKIAIQKLTTHPFAFGIYFKDVRKIQLKTFPYLVLYQVNNYEVYVHAVIHAKRSPAFYKREIRKRTK